MYKPATQYPIDIYDSEENLTAEEVKLLIEAYKLQLDKLNKEVLRLTPKNKAEVISSNIDEILKASESQRYAMNKLESLRRSLLSKMGM